MYIMKQAFDNTISYQKIIILKVDIENCNIKADYTYKSRY